MPTRATQGWELSSKCVASKMYGGANVSAMRWMLVVLALGTLPAAGQREAREAASAKGPDLVSASSFDVVSVRPSDPRGSGFAIRPDPKNFSVSGATLKFLVGYAYDLNDFQVVGASGWMDSQRFDIRAKMDEPGPGPPQKDVSAMDPDEVLKARLRTLLADRFDLKVAKASREMPIFGLRVVRKGPKLPISKLNSGYSESVGQIRCTASTMEGLAAILSDMVDRVVVDQTKLRGIYAFTLKWTPPDRSNSDSENPGLFTALREQLGLELVTVKGPVTTVRVERAQLPPEN